MSEMTPVDKMSQSLEFLKGIAELMHPDIEITRAGRRVLGWMLDEFALHITQGIEELKRCRQPRTRP